MAPCRCSPRTLTGDGDSDVLSASLFDDTIAWYENADGAGSFGPLVAITSSADGAASVHAADVDGDGDIDALSASPSDDTVAWYENTDGAGSFGPQLAISTSAGGPESVFAADVDGDGDVDVITAAFVGDKVVWYENLNGSGSFGPERVVYFAGIGRRPVQATAADVDRDGDSDIVVAELAGRMLWAENLDGLGNFAAPQPIADRSLFRLPWSVFVADVDGDGDLDVLSASGDVTSNSVAWHENRFGQTALRTISGDQGFRMLGDEVELFRVEAEHLGRAEDGDAELALLGVGLDGYSVPPLTSGPPFSLDNNEANALIESLSIYVDDGSGVFESGSDTLVANVPSLSLSNGIQMIALADSDPNARVPSEGTRLFFAVATLSSSSGPARSFAPRHPSVESVLHHASTNVVLSQAPASGTQPRRITVLDPAIDEDGDTLLNADEVDVLGTNPLLSDSDFDGLLDGDEINNYGTDPTIADTDSDGLSDGAEVNIHGSDPTLPDTDSDGLLDGAEIATGSNPSIADTDGDGLSDGHEVNVYGTNPLLDGDDDGDGILDVAEIARGMNPTLADTDGDGIADDVDNCPSAYNPFQEDSAGFGGIAPDGIGDLCQNGDFNGDGSVDILDTTLVRRRLIGLEPALDPALPPSAP